MMTLDTRRLFIKLLNVLEVDCACDIGALNGTEALDFHHAVPAARVFAFEANPINAELIRSRPEIAAHSIQLLERAITNYDGHANFFIVDTDYKGASPQRGMSSLFQREGAPVKEHPVSVTAQRLDTFFALEGAGAERAALWIDVEGKAYEVLEGLGTSASRTAMLHAEVETIPCIHPDQKLRADFVALASKFGFELLACDGPETLPQQNLLFVRKDLIGPAVRRTAFRVKVWTRLRSVWWCVRQMLRLP